MQLSELLRHTDVIEIIGDDSAEITSLGFDSRAVCAGQLFFALRGTQSDGHNYIGNAVEKGAAAIVCEELPAHISGKAIYVKVADSSAAIGEIASLFYDEPSRKLKLVGVTGTNGKTSIATLLYDMFRKLGYKAGLISTVSYCIDNEQVPSTHTTPDALRLNAMIAEMAERGCDYCFMEVSSHSVVQQRIHRLHFTGGIFTNITHDHLDYHGTFAEYIRAKKLFFDNLPGTAFALVNIDDRNGRVMVQNTKAAVKSYSLRSLADFKCKVLETTPEGMLLNIDSEQVWVKFLGGFNAYNLLAVYGTAILLGVSKHEALTSLSTLTPVNGRFDTIRSHNGITAIVDYAHTPDALQNVIDTINEIRGSGKLYVVVGCGGNRDKTKRPEMARIATEHTDLAIFTSDNPRNEDPEAILADMKAGAAITARYLTITDRGEAIKTAAMMASPGDIILIAGKGHETYQIIGNETRHFDDKEEITRIFNNL